MENVFIRKLAGFAPLSAGARAALSEACLEPRWRQRHEVIVAQGAVPHHAHVILDGMGCRYKLLPDGSRQILDFLVPGDLADGHALFRARMDHEVGSLSACLVVAIPHRTIIDLTDRYPAVARAFWFSALAQESVAREWLLNIGRRSAETRLAHLLCELCARLDAVGRGQQGVYDLPLTQAELADANGISAVHMNRMLKRLRTLRLVTLRDEVLTVMDRARLEAFCAFDPAYLHDDERRERMTP